MKGHPSSGAAVNHTWTENNLASHYNRVFERTAVDVSIYPLECSTSVTASCYSSTEKAAVILKSSRISFFVTKTFTMKNIMIDASELIPDSNCYEEYKYSSTRCCVDNSETPPIVSNTVLTDGSSNDAICSPPTTWSTADLLIVPWEAYSPEDDIWQKGPYAFFVINFLRDYPSFIPSLVLEGCIFKNFWYHRYAYSFIYMDQRGAQLSITNTEFENFYFPMGLITNVQKITQKNSFFTMDVISTKIQNCTTLNPSLSNCHSLTITDSSFKKSNFGNYTLGVNVSYWYSNEGIVLALHEFGGPIYIKGSTFE